MMTTLLARLDATLPLIDELGGPRQAGRPKSARALSGEIAAILPHLPQLGIEIEREPVHGARNHRITDRRAAGAPADENPDAAPDPQTANEPWQVARRARFFDDEPSL